MSERVQCPHCKTRIAGKGRLKRHIVTMHKLKSLAFLENLTGTNSVKTMGFDGKSTFSITK